MLAHTYVLDSAVNTASVSVYGPSATVTAETLNTYVVNALRPSATALVSTTLSLNSVTESDDDGW